MSEVVTLRPCTRKWPIIGADRHGWETLVDGGSTKVVFCVHCGLIRYHGDDFINNIGYKVDVGYGREGLKRAAKGAELWSPARDMDIDSLLEKMESRRLAT